MKRALLYLYSSLLLMLPLGCNTEKEMKLIKPNSYLKLIEGRGTDSPIAIRALSDGNILIVSNSLSFEQGQQLRKIRVLKLNKDGDILKEKYLPEKNVNWSVADVITLRNHEVMFASTVLDNAEEDSSLLFYRINEDLDSISSISYQNNARYDLYGVSEDEQGLVFMAQEFKNGQSYPIIGEINLDNTIIKAVKRAEKYNVAPATKAFRNSAGQFVWAYNRSKSYIAKVQPDLLQINDQEVTIRNQRSVRAKQLIMKSDQPVVFGEVINENTQVNIFYFNQALKNTVLFGGLGDTHLNNVHVTDDGYLVTGFENSSTLGNESIQNNFFISRRNAAGTEVFSKTFGTDDNQELSDATMIEGKIYAIGKTVFGDENTLVLIKMDAFGRF